MSYLDLPGDWTAYPLSNPDFACDVADFLVSDHDRAANSLLVLHCDGDGFAMGRPQLAPQTTWDRKPERRRRALQRFFNKPAPGIVVAVCAAERVSRAVEVDWAITVEEMCAEHGVTLMSMHSLCLLGNFHIVPPKPLPAPEQVRRELVGALSRSGY